MSLSYIPFVPQKILVLHEMNEKLNLKHGRNISITITHKKTISYVKFPITGLHICVLEFDAENHLSMPLEDT